MEREHTRVHEENKTEAGKVQWVRWVRWDRPDDVGGPVGQRWGQLDKDGGGWTKMGTNPDSLGHIITNAGIHACADKMQKIRDWRQPRNFHEVQRFLGLVQYLAHYMPDVTAYTSPLTTCVRNGRQFVWTPLYDKCFESIKALAFFLFFLFFISI